MKFSSLVVSLAMATSASAFVPMSRVGPTSTRMSVSQMEPTTTASTTEGVQEIAAAATAVIAQPEPAVFFTPPTETIMNVESAMPAAVPAAAATPVVVVDALKTIIP
jgi:hypothetical protein